MTDAHGPATRAPTHRLTGWPAAAAWTAAVIGSVLGFVATVVLPLPGDTPAFVVPVFGVMVAAFGMVGALVGTRQPRNPIGWLLLLTGVTMGTSLAAQSYANLSVTSHGGTLPGTQALAWLSSWTFLPALGIVLVIVPLVYPTGHLLSRRWRVVVAVVGVASTLRLVHDAFAPGALSGVDGVANPVGIAVVASLTPVVPLGDVLMVFVCFPLAILATVLRYRRGTATERAQLKWFVSAAVFASFFLGLSLLAPSPLDDVGWLLGTMGFGLVPVAIGVALLRYRLYEIDRIISRTIAWTIVTGILVGGFALGIVALQGLLTGVTQGQTLAVAASTLLAFGVAQPLLRRVQTGVDRRFNRARYDAQRTVDDFGERLRDEVALEAVARDLQATIDLAVRPAAQALWLREAAR